jgi:hypothetical protein
VTRWPHSCDPSRSPHLVERYLSAVQRRVDIDLELGRHAELAAELQDLTSASHCVSPCGQD